MDSNDKQEDILLLHRIKKGDNDAVTDLYNKYVNRIYSMILNQVDRDRETAQEILQETFIAAVRSAGKFRGKSEVYTWLCSIASKKVADFYRRKKRESKYRSEYVIDPEVIGDTNLSIADLSESRETRINIRQNLFSLPLAYRQVLVLKYVEGFQVSEISDILQRSPKSVEGLLTRARKAFQEGLKL